MTHPEPSRLEGPIRSIGLVLRTGSPELAEVLDRLLAVCDARGVEVALEASFTGDRPDGVATLDLEVASVDLVVALGGDGTLLRAARSVLGRAIPVLGVNLGRLGFLTALPARDLEAGLAQVFDGGAVLDDRFTLCAAVSDEGAPERLERVATGASSGGGAPGETGQDGEGRRDDEDGVFHALNDIVVHTSGAARVAHLHVEIHNGESWEEAASFAADGVILATPTGSTAYSMSAGGPIIAPSVECIVLTPICPHSLAVRPLVVPAGAEIRVRARDDNAEYQLTVDGQVVRALCPTEWVTVTRQEEPVALVRLPGQTFLGTLRRKLNWAANPVERA